MVRDADRTKKQLLAAATAEFAKYGIAGARVDRIAESAGCNKAMIYAYFGDKDRLFDAVFSAQVGSVWDEVAFTATDLPAYVGRLFDYYEDHPQTVRLSTWYRLERPAGDPLLAVVDSNKTKLAKIARAQQDGILPTHYAPVELLALAISIAATWASVTPELGAAAPADRTRRRHTVVDAVTCLITPDRQGTPVNRQTTPAS